MSSREAEDPEPGPPHSHPGGAACAGPLVLSVQRAARASWLPADAAFQRWAEAAAGGAGGELTVRIVDETESRALNRVYRGKDRPTNVLSFPMQTPAGVPVQTLGDLVICAGMVEREAREQGKALEAHWAHLVVHGVLHLLGYDHADPESARQMEALEVRILAGLGHANPYEGTE